MDNPSAFISIKPAENQSEERGISSSNRYLVLVNADDVYDDPGSVITLPDQYLEPVVPPTVHSQPIANTNSSSRRSSHDFNVKNQNDDAGSCSSSSSTSEQGNSKENEHLYPNNIWSTWRHERQKWLAYNNDCLIPYAYQEFRITQPVFTAYQDTTGREKKHRELRTMSFKVTVILCGAVTVLTALITIFVAVYYGMMIPITIT